jgi:hypothetical protein
LRKVCDRLSTAVSDAGLCTVFPVEGVKPDAGNASPEFPSKPVACALYPIAHGPFPDPAPATNVNVNTCDAMFAKLTLAGNGPVSPVALAGPVRTRFANGTLTAVAGAPPRFCTVTSNVIA